VPNFSREPRFSKQDEAFATGITTETA
jgi:hypothetical protein